MGAVEGEVEADVITHGGRSYAWGWFSSLALETQITRPSFGGRPAVSAASRAPRTRPMSGRAMRERGGGPPAWARNWGAGEHCRSVRSLTPGGRPPGTPGASGSGGRRAVCIHAISSRDMLKHTLRLGGIPLDPQATATEAVGLHCPANGSTWFAATIRPMSWFWTWIAASAVSRASRRARPITATSAAPAITPCSCSTGSATGSAPPCG